jgi:hypothetical protein
MMLLLGLKDDYQHDGRAILELVERSVLPKSLHGHSDTLLELGQYKQTVLHKASSIPPVTRIAGEWSLNLIRTFDDATANTRLMFHFGHGWPARKQAKAG